MNRRRVLGLAAGACATLPLLPRRLHGAQPSATRFGAAIDIPRLVGDPDYRRNVERHCTIVTPIGGLKWIDMRPDPATFWFGLGDQLVDFALRHGMAARGHTLVWHDALPRWVQDLSDRAEMRRAFETHISTVVGRYAGRIASWDVVNEPLPEDQAHPAERRPTIWSKNVGEDYISRALTLAAAADSAAELVINEYDLEFAGARYARKRAGMLDLLARVKRSGAPVHALGLQAHLRGERSVDKPALARFIREITGMGLSILITELDVMDYALPSAVAPRDAAVAARVSELLDVVFANCTPRAVVTWGLTDRHAGVAEHFKRPDGLPVRSLPLDQDYAPKLFQRVLEKHGALARPGAIP